MSNRKIPPYVRNVLKKLEENGFRAYLVGGCVRDALMGRRIHDWDITTDALPEETMAIFEKTVPTGIGYGTVTVISGETKAEVTTFRADGDYNDSRHPENVKFVSDLSKDLSRRDFTVNAMTMDLRGEITDLFGGTADIEKKIIKCVGEPERRFSEDALRMLRAVRFSAQLGFEIEENTERAMALLGENVRDLSAERVLEETVKILMSPRPEALMTAFEYGMYSGRTDETPDMKALKRIKYMRKDKALRLCALSCILGDGIFLKNLKADSKTQKLRKAAASIQCETDREIRLALAEYGYKTVLDVCAVKDARYGGKRERTARLEIKSGSVITRENLAVSGDDLVSAGLEKGPKIGEILRSLLYYVNDNPLANNKYTLVEMALDMDNNMVF